VGYLGAYKDKACISFTFEKGIVRESDMLWYRKQWSDRINHDQSFHLSHCQQVQPLQMTVLQFQQLIHSTVSLIFLTLLWIIEVVDIVTPPEVNFFESLGALR
jgi:hypothetical protein